MARIEFYRKGGGLIVAVDDGAVPRSGELVNIERRTWTVDHVTWAVDQPGGGIRPRMRANVEMTEAE